MNKSDYCDPYQLIELLMRSGKQLELQLDTVLASAGLSTAKWSALKQLAEADGQLPLGQLAARLSCVKSNATRLIDCLEAEKLVRRTPDPQDRRSIHAELTDEGRRRYAAGWTVVQQFERQLLRDYTPQELTQFEALLVRLPVIKVS